jgi:hypothetical protein
MKIKVIVYRRPNMFKVQDNLFSLAGYGELKKAFSDEAYKTEHKRLTLFYPERFLNIIEQRSLFSRLEACGYEEVEIATHSVYIIQCTPNGCCLIVEDEIIDECDDSFKMSNDPSGMPEDNGLTVL